MIRSKIFLISLLFIPSLWSMPPHSPSSQRLIIKKKIGANPRKIEHLYEFSNLKIENQCKSLAIDFCRSYSITQDFEDFNSVLLSSGLIESVERDAPLWITEFPNDTYYRLQWSLENSKNSDMNVKQAWSRLFPPPHKIIIGVIDTGIDFDHDDLKGNIWINKQEQPYNGIDDDQNGYIDDQRGWNFYHDNNFPFDSVTHGTHVSGIIGAITNNGFGIAGINSHVEFMALKFINTQFGFISDAIRAIEYAVLHGAKIINASWGGGGFSPTLESTLRFARDHGVLFVAAAGNNGRDIDLAPFYPASYSISNVLSVASSNIFDRLSSFSNYGERTVDIAAPGEDILSTIPYNRFMYNSGTSMAAPMVSGVAAYIAAYLPEASAESITAVMLQAAEPKPSYSGRVKNAARLNADIPNLLPQRISEKILPIIRFLLTESKI